MKILLDIDGVLVTTPGWRQSELLPDGFLKFNDKAANNLSNIINRTQATIVLTTTHRFNYSIEQWKQLLMTRGITSSSIEKINDAISTTIGDRAYEIEEWVNRQSDNKLYVVIDDDLSINRLPVTIKDKCVLTKPMIGGDQEATEMVLDTLLGNTRRPTAAF